MAMDAADRKAGEIQDFLYTGGVRTDENVHLSIHATVNDDAVSIAVYPNHWHCDGCRSRRLVSKILHKAARDSLNDCPGCRIKSEENGFHARAKLAEIVKALENRFTLFDERTCSSSAHVYVRI